jgi:lipopolysaccharide transport system permease protein
MVEPLILLWQRRRIIRTTALNDARARYLGTVFGLVWIILYPLLFLAIYGTVYSRIFIIRVEGFSTVEYIQIIFCGLVPFIGFSETLSSGTTAVTGNKGLIRNTLFPIELIPVKVVLTSSISLIASLGLLMAFLWSQGTFHMTQLLVPYILFLQLVFSIGVAWILSALSVFIPDIAQVMGIIILILMIVSPIAYVRSMVPDNLTAFLLPNPLYYLISLYRDAAFFGYVGQKMLLGFSVASFITFYLGWFLFTRLKALFTDYV